MKPTKKLSGKGMWNNLNDRMSSNSKKRMMQTTNDFKGEDELKRKDTLERKLIGESKLTSERK